MPVYAGNPERRGELSPAMRRSVTGGEDRIVPVYGTEERQLSRMGIPLQFRGRTYALAPRRVSEEASI